MNTPALITPDAMAVQVLEELRINELGQDMAFRTIATVLERNGVLVTDWNRKLVLKRIRRALKKLPRITRLIPKKTQSDRPMNSADAHARWERERELQTPVIEQPLTPKIRLGKKGQYEFDLEPHRQSA
jgi:hypothetical protein